MPDSMETPDRVTKKTVCEKIKYCQYASQLWFPSTVDFVNRIEHV